MNPADGFTRDPDRLYPEVLAALDARTPAMDVAGKQPLPTSTDFTRAKEAAMHGLEDIKRLNANIHDGTARSIPAADELELIDVARYVGILRNEGRSDPVALTTFEADTIADYLVAAYGIQE